MFKWAKRKVRFDQRFGLSSWQESLSTMLPKENQLDAPVCFNDVHPVCELLSLFFSSFTINFSLSENVLNTPVDLVLNTPVDLDSYCSTREEGLDYKIKRYQNYEHLFREPHHQLESSALMMFPKYSRLPLSQIPRDSLKHFELSVLRHIRVERVRKTINWTTTFNQWICNLTPEVRNMYRKITWNRREIALEQFLLFSTLFCYLLS